jgi:SET domain-containing protein
MLGSTYLSPKAAKGTSFVHGVGLFAREPIRRHEVVAIKGGHIMTSAEWTRLEPLVGQAAEVYIATGLVIAPRTRAEYEGSMMHLNHSCEPNVGVEGQIVFIALRDVAAKEELLLDYAMMDDHDERMTCSCQAAACRGVVSGKDWELPELQRRYKGYFSSYLERRILDGR